MARSYKSRQGTGTNPQTPPNWTDLTRHKYCGALDLGRAGKANKAQKCLACLQIKAHRDGITRRETSQRREDKMQSIWNLHNLILSLAGLHIRKWAPLFTTQSFHLGRLLLTARRVGGKY
ncbi:hypothetical protein SPI_09385 [Niveomyces insectorum RCEF 264]|uniref:Uncharacterized protein n=1 Tax=Niveomyces insectorum RCEF 264 TaxID=1081102 RepID=A0A167LSS9_9HYPO|nr:hypothetical protein SPI_09385 [Niveomyces insectorum RCEF 264]